jgi:hypothetical protein
MTKGEKMRYSAPSPFLGIPIGFIYPPSEYERIFTG